MNATSDIFRLVHAGSDQIMVKRRVHSPAHQAVFVQSSSDPDRYFSEVCHVNDRLRDNFGTIIPRADHAHWARLADLHQQP